MSDERGRAEQFAERFRAVYLTFHRRDGPRGQLQGASRAVLEHLAMAGPLTIGEAASHLDRAQSVVSDIVSHLESQQLLERERDPADRRRTLVWLTPAGQSALRRDREVLGLDQLARALDQLPPGQADALIAGLGDLVRAVASLPGEALSTPSATASTRPSTHIHLASRHNHHQQTKARAAMTTPPACESCGMPIETGRYCGYCTDESGQLQSFDQRFERMVAWQARRNPDAAREELERQTLSYMATMPAWQDHPRVARGDG